jgi:hypothetical protein
MQSINWQGRHNSLSGKLMDDTLEKLHSNFGFDYGKLNGKNESFMSYYIFNPQTGLLKSLTEEGITIDMLKELPGTKYIEYSSLEDFFRDNMDANSINILFDDIFRLLQSERIARSKKSKKPKTERNTKRKKRKKQTRKRRVSQKGGFVPCLTCLGPVAAFAGGALGGASFVMKSSSSKSSISNINGKRSVKRKEKYQMNKNGKTHKREFKQMNKRVYDGKKMSEYDNLKEANEAYNSLIKECKSKGFQKC